MFGLFVAISLFEIVTGVPKVFQLMNDPVRPVTTGSTRLAWVADLQERRSRTAASP